MERLGVRALLLEMDRELRKARSVKTVQDWLAYARLAQRTGQEVAAPVELLQQIGDSLNRDLAKVEDFLKKEYPDPKVTDLKADSSGPFAHIWAIVSRRNPISVPLDRHLSRYSLPQGLDTKCVSFAGRLYDVARDLAYLSTHLLSPTHAEVIQYSCRGLYKVIRAFQKVEEWAMRERGDSRSTRSMLAPIQQLKETAHKHLFQLAPIEKQLSSIESPERRHTRPWERLLSRKKRKKRRSR